MTRSIYRVIPVFALIFVFFGAAVFAQTAGVSNVPPAVQQVQDSIRKVLDDSGRNFHEGMVALKANRRSDSGAAFDRSVETFLMSTLDIQRDKSLQSCYSQLIETIYRIEFPNASQPPQIRSLSATCQWKWNDVDMKLADDVAAITKTLKPSASAVAVNGNTPAGAQTPTDAIIGFNEQGFEPSPRDELAKLELTPEEQEVESNPEAQQQYQDRKSVV